MIINGKWEIGAKNEEQFYKTSTYKLTSKLLCGHK